MTQEVKHMLSDLNEMGNWSDYIHVYIIKRGMEENWISRSNILLGVESLLYLQGFDNQEISTPCNFAPLTITIQLS